MSAEGNLAPGYDAIVVGARCAGAATAMLLARRGARVLMIDGADRGTGTISTHALMQGAVMQLSSWGLLERIRGAATPAIRTTAFIYGGEVVEQDIEASHGVDALYAPRRYLLDSVLVDAAIEAGADVRFGISCRGLLHGPDGRVRGILAGAADGATFSMPAGIVIGADGRRSSVARFACAATERQSRNVTAITYGYFEGMPGNGYRWHYAPSLAAGAVPTNDGKTCVFAAMPRELYLSTVRGHLEVGPYMMMSFFPELRKSLASARLTGRPIGFIGQKGYMRQAAGAGWALVGDAGCFMDPLTAQGITGALRDAEILARAFTTGSGDLTDYHKTRNALSVDLFELTDLIASLSWTMDELKVLHKRLNRAMKEEQDWMATAFKPDPCLA